MERERERERERQRQRQRASERESESLGMRLEQLLLMSFILYSNLQLTTRNLTWSGTCCAFNVGCNEINNYMYMYMHVQMYAHTVHVANMYETYCMLLRSGNLFIVSTVHTSKEKTHVNYMYMYMHVHTLS